MQRVEMSDRQSEIVDVAIRLLATQGARRFTVARLAAEIGVTGGAIYRHFESMEAIVDAVVARLGCILFEGFPPESTDPLDRLKAFFLQRTRILLANPHISRLFHCDQLSQTSGPAQAERLIGYKRRSRDLVIDCLREAQRIGALAEEVDPEAGAILVLGSILALAHANSRFPSEARAPQLVERVWRMIEYALRGAGPASALKKTTKAAEASRKERGEIDMSMFCFQCQETLKNSGCTKRGVCGKEEPTANLQDLLIHTLKGIGLHAREARRSGVDVPSSIGRFVAEALFTTITNVDFDADHLAKVIEHALAVRGQAKTLHKSAELSHDAAIWTGAPDAFADKATAVGVLATENVDIRSLRELLIYGLKGIAAYADHAAILGHEDAAIYDFMFDALASTTEDLSQDKMVEMVMKAGETAVTVMALLDKANTSAYGQPELTRVNIGVRDRPGILISGHDLKDLEELLEQSKDAGVDIYTHGEMLPAHYYPAFKKYDHLVGNYGNAWWQQQKEFDSFNGPILLTTNCIVPVRDSYKDRIYTTGRVAYPDVTHIPDRKNGSPKDFSAIIEKARGCKPPTELESGEITGGFAHNQVLALADKVVAAVKTGAIKRFVVMAGCDGRQKGRSYYTEVAENLPKDTIILTAGCAKYRYNKLDLGDIGGIPRVLDAGQCNDSYSLAVVALKLKEVFGLADINELPISFDIAWYEQKAVTVLLALLHLGVKGIRLGPTLPAFLSPNVAKVLVDNFDIKPIGDVQGDIAAMMAGN